MFRTTVLILVLALAPACTLWAQTLPPGGWTGNETIGTAAAGDAVSPSPGVYEITGNGNDIWGTADAFQYLYKELTGDGVAICRVVDNGSGTNTWAKGGVMIRQDTTPGSVHAMMIITGGNGGGAGFQRRLSANGTSTSNHNLPNGPHSPPRWVKVERVGDDFNAYWSTDGETWTKAGDTVTIAMQDPVLIGLCVTSHAAGELRTFTFDNVSFEGDVTGEHGPEAAEPVPADLEEDVITTATLTWLPGLYASQHDLYLGTDFTEVNEATVADAAYVGRLDDASYTPADLQLGQTYYWRVDEPNDTPDKTVFKGPVWSFTVEPVSFGVPVTAISATASSTLIGDPNSVINGAGLNADDQHGVDMTQMWASSPADPEPSLTIALAQLEKLDKLHVWNHNSETEALVGFGIKDARIETSRDGQTWTDLGTVVIPQGSGTAAETGTDIPLNGSVAQYVRITGLSNYSKLGLAQRGLAEVRVYAIPMRARREVPADGTTDLDPLVDLGWRSGREAVQHEVLAGTDPNALTLIDTVDSPAATASVALDSTIYWRVNEVDPGADPATWEGPLWSFQTNAFLSVDEFEAYASEEGKWIWETWVDGFGDNANGALLGHGGDDMETSIVYAGRQSVPYTYGQNGAANSEASLPLAQDWSQHGIVSLSLMFFGQATNTPGTMYLKVNGQRIADYPVPADLTLPQWQAWTVDLPASALRPVTELTLGFDGGSGLVYIDAIRVYPQASQTVTPADPGSDGLMAYYPFEGNTNDASGNGFDGTPVNNPLFLNDAARGGQVLALDGLGACVDLGASDAFNFPGSFSLGVWTQIQEFTTSWGHVLIGKRGENNLGWQLRRHSGTPNLVFTLRGTAGADDPRGTVDVTAFTNEWFHVTAVYDMEAGQRTVYINGLTDVSIEDANAVAAATHNTYIGARANAANTDVEGPFTGSLDDVRVYNRALSQDEALGLAGRQDPIFKEF